MEVTAPIAYGVHPTTRELVGSTFADPDPMNEGAWLVPANAFLEEPPAPAPGHVVRRAEDLAGWEVVQDNRGLVYSTETGLATSLTELGELPAGFTKDPRPDEFHMWDGQAWVLDDAAWLRAKQAAEREWRDVRLALSDYLVMPDYPLQDAARAELVAYRQALRDWPEHSAFPAIAGRPAPPSWLVAE